MLGHALTSVVLVTVALVGLLDTQQAPPIKRKPLPLASPAN
jgi:hypothetical protein